MLNFYTDVLGFTISDRGPLGPGAPEIVFMSNDPDSPHAVSLTGWGLYPPEISATPDPVVGAVIHRGDHRFEKVTEPVDVETAELRYADHQPEAAYGSQLDEIARGLITTFAETDQTGGGGPDLAAAKWGWSLQN